jgi:predicted TIM-barrel fold metal-dependent hydrolase
VILGADGVRINLHLKPCDDWENLHFFKLLEKCVSLHLPVCLQLTPDYLNLLKNLAGRFPTKYIIDHLGRPKSGSSPTDDGFLNLLALSKSNNIYIKLSGMNYYSNQSAPYRDTWNLLETVKEHFGPDHCMWGSDYPFVEEHWSYTKNLNLIYKKLRFTENDLDFILCKTARSLWWN